MSKMREAAEQVSHGLLHKTKLDEFKEWLDAEGFAHRPGKGEWQVLQVSKDGKHWNGIYNRIDMPEHFTTDGHLDVLVARYCRQRNTPNVEFSGATQLHRGASAGTKG